MDVPVEDQKTRLILKLPEGSFTIHTNITDRPHGEVVTATVEPRAIRGKPAGYSIRSLATSQGSPVSLHETIKIDPTLIVAS